MVGLRLGAHWRQQQQRKEKKRKDPQDNRFKLKTTIVKDFSLRERRLINS